MASNAVFAMLLLVVLVVWGIPRDCAGQRYAMLAPRTVRPHTVYELMVSNLGSGTEHFMYEIVNANDTVVGATFVEVKPNELRKVEVSLNSLKEGHYRLKVWEKQKQTLLNTTALERIDRSYLVLFQTDKPAYKPGDRVQFRVLFLLPDTKPVGQSVRPTIFIADPDRVRMKQWNGVSLSSGVFEGSFQLAEYTSFGRWTITVSVNEQIYKDTFSVEEYTLPLYRVQVQSIPKPYFQCDDPKMSLKLSASFVHGGSVRGNATVVVRANYNNYPSQTKEVARKELSINGTAIVDFPTDVVAKSCDEERNVWFDVIVTESSTGISYNTTCSYTVHNAGGVTMEVLDGNEAFYPGLAMRLMVKLATIDEKPLVNQPVTVRYKVLDEDRNDIDEVAPSILSLQTNANGVFRVAINTSMSTAEVIVEGVYRNHIFPLVFAYPMYEERSLEYLAITTRQAYCIVRRNITVDVHSNVRIDRIYYVGYCHGKVCVGGVHKSTTRVNTHHLTLTSSPQMAPQMKLLAFAVKDDGKILSSSIIIRFMSSSSSALNVTEHLMEPNSDRYSFNILAEKDAFVGLLGVDERIKQRTSTNNDITQQKWEKMLQSLEGTSGKWSSYDSFGSVGVTLLTDGYLPQVGFIPHSFGELARTTSTLDEDDSVREDFPETWLWESIRATNGQTSIERSLPDTITTWVVSGFSVGPANGLQILKKPLQIKSQKRIFVQLHMPPSIKRFEEVSVHCLVHNYGKAINVSLEVRPTMQVTPLYLAQGATENVRVSVSSSSVGVLTLEVFLRDSKGKVLDSVRQSIPVRPEGLIRTVEDVRVLDFPQQSKLTFNLALPAVEQNRDVNYREVTLSVIGTFLNLNMFDLEHMVRSSHGNGEETLLFLQTTMAVYDYLKRANLLSPDTKQKLFSYMDVGYQQLSRYRLDDGSFSMFGNLHECGGVWFTASTVQALGKLIMYEAIPVEIDFLNDGLNWLMLQSGEDGSFNESCPIAHPHIQRTGGKELSLASSVMFAFVGKELSREYKQFINKTISLLLVAPINDVYLLAKTTYLLTLINHPDSARMLAKLNSLAIVDGKYRYWSVSGGDPRSSPEKRDQEATAYALLTNIKRNAINHEEMIRIAQWLQKHTFAGDRSVASLERIVALEALGALAHKIPTTMPNMYIEAGGHKFEIDATNRELLQTVQLPQGTTGVRVSARGTGLVLMKLSVRYSLASKNATRTEPSNASNSEKIGVNIKKRQVENHKLALYLCVSLLKPLLFYEPELWKVEVDLPTGYEIEGQEENYHNSTESAIVLENKSHLELVWNVRQVSQVCYPIVAIARWSFVDIVTGLLYLTSFDTKDTVAVYAF
ncbi:CD109 antigen-like [Anopheles merus]|uniref:CD109 antigen-like n=1 Tax=Anopheles merus TaxID=30066 RepID=UPI001BE482FA|nr:CD109 antigen-like [Anopheles merus]